MDFRLPTLGEGADSGTVVNILVKEGEEITKGQTVIELETGKAVTPIPSNVAGPVTKVMVKEGQKISVGTPILSVGGAGGEAPEAPAAAPKKAAAPKPVARKAAAAPEPEQEELAAGEAEEDFEYSGQLPPPASPSLRRLAQDLGIDLRRVRGSEGGGRIVIGDLKAYIANLQKLAKKAQAPAPTAAGAKPKPAAEQIDFSRFGSVYKRPMTPLRKVIAQRMAENWNAIPHVTQFDNIDLTNLMALRKKYVEAYEKKGAKLTVTALSLRAVVNALKKHPIFNSSLDEVSEEIVFKEYYNIGIAVDTDQGLIVPVIKNADKKSVFDLAKELAELAEKTRDRKVGMEDLQGGTFTISNQGAFGGAHFTPIVNKPEVAILGMGKGALQPVVTKDGKIEARTILPVGLSYDHRVIDGGSAARFIVDLVNEFVNLSESEVKL